MGQISLKSAAIAGVLSFTPAAWAQAASSDDAATDEPASAPTSSPTSAQTPEATPTNPAQPPERVTPDQSNAGTQDASQAGSTDDESQTSGQDQDTGQASATGPVVDELERLRQQQADIEDQHQAEQEAQQERAAAAQQAMNAIGNAQQEMAYGSDDFAEVLDQAAHALTGPAQGYVQLAQAALANGDLYTARTCLQSALALGAIAPSGTGQELEPSR